MSRHTFAIFSASLLLSASAWAQTAHGGFTGPVTVSNTEQAKTLKDDAPVTLRGQLERHLGGDHYLFRDSTGTIQVEIDQRRWNGQSVSPQDTVEISGEVDKDWSSSTIDVKRLHKL